MTEQEAIICLEAWSATHQNKNYNLREAVLSGIKALEEIQQYRELGTVEELRDLKQQIRSRDREEIRIVADW